MNNKKLSFPLQSKPFGFNKRNFNINSNNNNLNTEANIINKTGNNNIFLNLSKLSSNKKENFFTKIKEKVTKENLQ